MENREIALETLRELASESTTDDEVRLAAATTLLHADEPDASMLMAAADGVQAIEDRLAAVEQAVGKRRLRLKA